MSAGKSDLRPDIHRALLKLNDLPDGSVIVDKYGHAWQKGAYVGEWYRAYDGDGYSSWALSQFVGSIQVLRDGVA